MANGTTISGANPLPALEDTDHLPVGRPGVKVAYNITLADLIEFIKDDPEFARLLDKLAFIDRCSIGNDGNPSWDGGPWPGSGSVVPGETYYWLDYNGNFWVDHNGDYWTWM